jgi:hypothetical protein
MQIDACKEKTALNRESLRLFLASIPLTVRNLSFCLYEASKGPEIGEVAHRDPLCQYNIDAVNGNDKQEF